MNVSNALVLFSGGQDSAICLAWALTHHSHVETIGFDYGQRHAVELDCRQTIITAIRKNFPCWAHQLGEDHVIDLKILGQISDTALTGDTEIAFLESGLPNTFVPGRNIIFLTMAAALSYRRGIPILVGGMCETDYSGYPDCRDDAIKSLQVCLNIGMAAKIRIETPLMWLNKSQTWKMAETLGGSEFVELVRNETHTCYMGERNVLHSWGYGCGACPACKLRATGYASYLDQLRTAS
ncbi:MAG: 7-cyano-7-deazaguanine synthase QueC [Magnetococcales bacterium]|nr:7-cyano-7-deazaguanine synthase QueC [Magnetococcales bacterium]MBF0115779.1 7-cyano-7-deazaguanine synthase QueC [Magnetococcales bacterium]